MSAVFHLGPIHEFSPKIFDTGWLGALQAVAGVGPSNFDQPEVSEILPSITDRLSKAFYAISNAVFDESLDRSTKVMDGYQMIQICLEQPEKRKRPIHL